MGKNECYEQALQHKPDHASSWYNLGVEGGGMVSGKAYSKKECYEQALQHTPDHANAWNNLGVGALPPTQSHVQPIKERSPGAASRTKTVRSSRTHTWTSDHMIRKQMLMQRKLENAYALNALHVSSFDRKSDSPCRIDAEVSKRF